MFNFDYITKKITKQHNQNGSEILHHPCKILKNGSSGSEKTINLINLDLKNHEPDIDKKKIYAKDLYEVKYKSLINKKENKGLKYLNDSKTFIEYSNGMYDIYKNTKEYNPNKKQKL